MVYKLDVFCPPLSTLPHFTSHIPHSIPVLQNSRSFSFVVRTFVIPNFNLFRVKKDSIRRLHFSTPPLQSNSTNKVEEEMFAFKVATILAVVSTAVLAAPTPEASSCSTGKVQCCDSIAPSGSSSNAMLLGLLPTNLQGLDAPLGLNCVPLNIVGVGSSGSCNAQTACCGDIHNTGLLPIGINCSPMNIGL